MVNVETTTEKYWKKSVFSQLMKREVSTMKAFREANKNRLLNILFYQKYLLETKIKNSEGSGLFLVAAHPGASPLTCYVT